jgi:5-formyltetrahydrofolate cyclo-ligase
MLKSIARKLFLDKRKALTASDCMKMDDLLLIQFQRIDWSSVQCIGSFYPLDHQNEPDSLLLIRYLKLIIPGLVVVYPRVNQDQITMSYFIETETVEINKWGIPEPLPISLIAPSKIDAILVPLIGFDEIGHRIGFGKGFYDRYFEQYPSDRNRIGISYFEPIPKIEDTHEFDVPLTHCITPSNSYEFQ